MWTVMQPGGTSIRSEALMTRVSQRVTDLSGSDADRLSACQPPRPSIEFILTVLFTLSIMVFTMIMIQV